MMITTGSVEMVGQARQMEHALELDAQHARSQAKRETVRVTRPRFVSSEFFMRRFGMLTGRIKTQPA